jgi:hypothetical protein
MFFQVVLILCIAVASYEAYKKSWWIAAAWLVALGVLALLRFVIVPVT